jgi:hypothetical protein
MSTLSEQEAVANQDKLRAVLAQYEALRGELLQKFRHHLQLYSVTVAALSVIIAYVLAQKAYDVLLVIPMLSSAFAFRYIWEQNVIVLLCTYVREEIEGKMIPALIGRRLETREGASEEYWLGWEHYFMERFPRPHFYKYTIELLFVALPFAPALVFSGFVLLSAVVIKGGVESNVPIPVHASLLLLYLFLAYYLSRKLWTA